MDFNIMASIENERKLIIAEHLFTSGESIRTISRILKIGNGKVSDYLKDKGYTIEARVGNSDYNRKELFEKLEEKWLAEGGSIKKLCKEYHTTPVSFTKFLRSRGHIITPHRNPGNTQLIMEKLNEAKELYLDGGTVSDVARKVKINNAVLADFLKEEGIDTLNNWKIPFKNKRIFKEIDTEEKAYWLGFFYADANITNTESNYSLDIALKFEDYNHLVKLKKFLQTEVEIKKRIIKSNATGKIHEACRLSISNKELVEDLISKGCVPRKSLILDFPDENILPPLLRIHFIRGYYDGDGSLFIPKKRKTRAQQSTLSFVGTQKFLLKLREELSLTNTKMQSKGNAFATYHGGNVKVEQYLNKIYENATIYLERKFSKYQYFLSEIKR